MPSLLVTLSTASILLCGAIFGFFYAWVCSTMWGLDQADPRVAIAAMQAMNASVRNIVFFPAFFLTPVAMLTTAALAWLAGGRRSAGLFAGAAVVYLIGGLALTLTINVPLNEALALQPDGLNFAEASRIWAEYSQPWQFWNQVRTGASGVSLLLATLGILQLRRLGLVVHEPARAASAV